MSIRQKSSYSSVLWRLCLQHMYLASPNQSSFQGAVRKWTDVIIYKKLITSKSPHGWWSGLGAVSSFLGAPRVWVYLLKSVPGAEHKCGFCNCLWVGAGGCGPAPLAGSEWSRGQCWWWRTQRPLHHPLQCPVLLTFPRPLQVSPWPYYMQMCEIFPFSLIDIFLKLVMSSAGIPMNQGGHLRLLGAQETYRVASVLPELLCR